MMGGTCGVILAVIGREAALLIERLSLVCKGRITAPISCLVYAKISARMTEKGQSAREGRYASCV
jgi:hypothetical protein